MNVAVFRHQYISITSLLYMYALTAIGNVVGLFNQSLVKHKDSQHNAAVWIVVLIALIVGGLVLAGLIWACNKFGGGRTFAGEFKLLGAYVKIKCA